VSRPVRILLRIAISVVILIIVTVTAGYFVVRSGWFYEYVRSSMITQIERATGGRVELGAYSFQPATLTATVNGFVLHGDEPAGETPLLRVRSVTVGLRIISALERKVDLAFVRVEQPMVRIVIYPDGRTNLPSPSQRLDNKPWPQEFLDLAVKRYEVAGGQIEVDERRAPLDFTGQGLQVRMSYDSRTPSYSGQFDSDSLRILAGSLGPLNAGVNAKFSFESSRIVFSQLRVTTRESQADMTGTLDNLRSPVANLNVKATGAVREMVKLFEIPVEPTGTATFTGSLTDIRTTEYKLRAPMCAPRLI
jgi:translocation and assembly module TamB